MNSYAKTPNPAPRHCATARISWRLLALAPALAAGLFVACSTTSPRSVAVTPAPRPLSEPVVSDSRLDQAGLTTAATPSPSVVSAYIAKRWRLGEARAHQLVQQAIKAASSQNVDALLVLAVAARESSFMHKGNPGGSADDIDPGRPHGLMQVDGTAHADAMPKDESGNLRVTTDAENLRLGAKVLREYLTDEHGDVIRALQRYNGNPRDESARYATSVLTIRRQLAHAV